MTNKEYLEEANKKFMSCTYCWNGEKCKLDGYPILDCLNCTTYKKKEEK